WEQREPAQVHYAAHRANGHLLLHANEECSHVKVNAISLDPKIVDTLWERDASGPRHEQDENAVMWCENCACRRVL
ncbi:MAG: hypothetical protein SYR96_38970, partial [Actinomycetota bacterium]|nr:hypothetical protein [Actinomycetota bacterium]